jgi:hypothetical protein
MFSEVKIKNLMYISNQIDSRNGHKSYAQIAEEFELTEENISQLSYVARFPIVCTDGKSPELFAK